ncbi:hypothetical protein AC578_4628 [Pseudocercospora eumusae]|uniref:FAD-binding domain-containing protein n=1 Tax=Pseudocercospora eumusae TaxID=321146 RepID=A0A139GZC5_9PEZI|nr:hypothetical protein AC578_4628 [Pseudocercospora eumusae]
MVIGCDGAHSKVRELLLGHERAALQPIGDFATATIYSKHTREHALQLRARPCHPLYQIGLHQKGFVSWLCVHNAEDKDHPENWTFFNYTSYRLPPGVDQSKWSKADLIRYQKNIVKENDFVDPFKSIYAWLSDDEENVLYTRLMDWDPRSPDHAWDNREGRVTLAGDAAHPMSFQRGQGLNNALQDALELRNTIASVWKDDDGVPATARKDALNAYEKQMIERGGKEVQLSRENTFMVHGENFQNSHLPTKGLNAESQA